MKKLILLILASLTSLTVQAAPACDPVALEEANNRYYITLYCASLENGFKECLHDMMFAGASMSYFSIFLKKTYSKPESKYLSQEAKRLIQLMEGGSDLTRMRYLPKLITELQKQPRLYYNQIKNLRLTVNSLRGRAVLGSLGLLTVIAAYAMETFMTMPEDCEHLTFDGLEKEDNQWVLFGLNCSKNVNLDFFKLDRELQLSILDRSPALCEIVTNKN